MLKKWLHSVFLILLLGVVANVFADAKAVQKSTSSIFNTAKTHCEIKMMVEHIVSTLEEFPFKQNGIVKNEYLNLIVTDDGDVYFRDVLKNLDNSSKNMISNQIKSSNNLSTFVNVEPNSARVLDQINSYDAALVNEVDLLEDVAKNIDVVETMGFEKWFKSSYTDGVYTYLQQRSDYSLLIAKLDDANTISKAQKQKFLYQFRKVIDDPSVLKPFNDNPALVDSWKHLYEEGITGLSNKLDDIEFVSKYLDDIKGAGGYNSWRTMVHSSVPPSVSSYDDYFDFLSRLDYQSYSVSQVDILIRNCPEREVGFVFDQSGNYLGGPVKGAVGKTQLSIPDLRSATPSGTLEGVVITHNHPSPDISLSQYDQDPTWVKEPFSETDIVEGLLVEGAAEIRAVNGFGEVQIAKNLSVSKITDIDYLDDIDFRWDDYKNAMGRSRAQFDSDLGLSGSEIDDLFDKLETRKNILSDPYDADKNYIYVRGELLEYYVRFINTEYGTNINLQLVR